MPGLDLCPLERSIKPNFHDLVLGAQYPFRHRLDPGMAHQVRKSLDRLRMHFHIPAPGPRPTAPPGRCIASQKAVIMSSLSCSTHSRENADFFATIPSR